LTRRALDNERTRLEEAANLERNLIEDQQEFKLVRARISQGQGDRIFFAELKSKSVPYIYDSLSE
jgi:hypothetical protein